MTKHRGILVGVHLDDDEALCPNCTLLCIVNRTRLGFKIALSAVAARAPNDMLERRHCSTWLGNHMSLLMPLSARLR